MHQSSSTRELSLIEKASRQILEFARKRDNFSDSTLDLMCVSASYVLHVVAKFDDISEEESSWQLEERSKVFDEMKVSLREWIARSDVIGGSSFGGNIPRYGSRTLRGNKGKKELQVMYIFVFHNNNNIIRHCHLISFGMHYFRLIVQHGKQVMTGKTLLNR